MVDAWLSFMSTTVREEYEVGDLDPVGVLEAAAEAEQAERRAGLPQAGASLRTGPTCTPPLTTPVSRPPAGPALLAGRVPGRRRDTGRGGVHAGTLRPRPGHVPVRRGPASSPTPSTCATACLMLWIRLSRLEVPAWQARRVTTADPPPPPGRRDLGRRTPGRAATTAGRRGHRPPRRPAVGGLRPKDHEDREDGAGRLGHHPPRAEGTDFLGTSHLEATGDTLTLKAFYDHVCRVRPPAVPRRRHLTPLGARKIKALGILTGQPVARQARRR